MFIFLMEFYCFCYMFCYLKEEYFDIKDLNVYEIMYDKVFVCFMCELFFLMDEIKECLFYVMCFVLVLILIVDNVVLFENLVYILSYI